MDVLVVASRYPWPARRGDQLRALQWVEFLCRGGHRARLLIPRGAPTAPPPPEGGPAEVLFYEAPDLFDRSWGGGHAALSGLPLQTALFRSSDLRRQLRAAAPRAGCVVLQLIRLAPFLKTVRSVTSGVPVVVDLIDSLALNFRQWAECTSPPKKWVLAEEARRLARWEGELVRQAEASLVVCDRDREAILDRIEDRAAVRRGGRSSLWTFPLAFPLHPQSDDPSSQPGGASGETVVLTGNLGYFVTVDGFVWWLREVWPRLRAARPSIKVVVAGARPAAELRRAAAQEGVELLADPEDLLAILRPATVAVAPMRFGAGQPLKILEAWQCGVPVVASPWAAAGTTGIAGEDFLLASTPEEWIRALLGLLDNASLRRRLVASAHRRLEKDYSREALQPRFDRFLRDLSAQS